MNTRTAIAAAILAATALTACNAQPTTRQIVEDKWDTLISTEDKATICAGLDMFGPGVIRDMVADMSNVPDEQDQALVAVIIDYCGGNQ